jgi:type II secretion system protein H
MGWKAVMMSPIGEKSKGFTLIEILLVIVIIGVLVSMAVPNFSKEYARFQLNAAANDLLTISRWAQAMAIGQGRVYALSFSDEKRSYRLLRASMDDQGSFEPLKNTIGKMHKIPEGIDLDVDNKNIEFHPDGTIDAATIQLNSSRHKVTLSSSAIRGMMAKVNSE